MAYCHNCGEAFGEDSSFCGSCGKEIDHSLSEQNAEATQEEQKKIASSQEVYPPKRKRRLSKKKIALVIGIIALIIFGIGFVVKTTYTRLYPSQLYISSDGSSISPSSHSVAEAQTIDAIIKNILSRKDEIAIPKPVDTGPRQNEQNSQITPPKQQTYLPSETQLSEVNSLTNSPTVQQTNDFGNQNVPNNSPMQNIPQLQLTSAELQGLLQKSRLYGIAPKTMIGLRIGSFSFTIYDSTVVQDGLASNAQVTVTLSGDSISLIKSSNDICSALQTLYAQGRIQYTMPAFWDIPKFLSMAKRCISV